MGRNKKKTKPTLPFVSVCTPTFNRRPFIESMIKCFDHQLYPKNRMEWIIIDDGTDKIEDLIHSVDVGSVIKYYKYDEKMSLGKKRNLMHSKCSGEIIVYMDDDDYYPPERVSHAVDMLVSHPTVLCAGSSEIYIYFNALDKVYQFGPYSANHGTAGTFAFKRKLLDDHSYNDDAALAEEKAFLKNYTVPFIQLDPKKVILVFSHEHNTFDKRKLLAAPNAFVKESDKTVDQFVKQSDLKNFYMHEIHELIKDYDAGKPEMKPDVIKQTKEIELRRAKEASENGKIVVQDADGKSKELTTPEIVSVIKNLQSENEQLKKQAQTGTTGIIMQSPDGTNKPLSNEEIAHVIKNMQEELRQLKSSPQNNTQDKQYIFTNENDEMEIISADEVNDYVVSLIDKLKNSRSAPLAPAPLVPKVPDPPVPDPPAPAPPAPAPPAPAPPAPDFESTLASFKSDIISEIKAISTGEMQLDVNGSLLGAQELKTLITQQSDVIQQLKTICNPIKFVDNEGNLTLLSQDIFDAIALVANNNFTTFHNDDVLTQHKVAHGNSSSNINFDVSHEEVSSDTRTGSDSESGSGSDSDA